MTTLVTGGTGFLGRHVVEQLVARGERVRVLARSYDPALSEGSVEQVAASLLDPEAVAEALQDVDQVYHLAGRVERDARRAHAMYDLHVNGTRNLLNAIDPEHVRRIVVASTSGTVGVGTDPAFLADDESDYVERTVRHWPYYLSKIYAERVCDEIAAARGLDVVQMRPTLLLGPADERYSSTHDVVLFLQRKIAATPEGGVSFVDARDAASAFLSAMQRGEAGAKYLITAANMSLADFFTQLEDISGVRAPGAALPGVAAEFGATVLSAALRALGAEPEVTSESVAMARHYWYVDDSRARRILQWQPREPRRTLRDTVRWIERNHPDFAKAKSRRPTPPDFETPRI